MGTPKKHSDLNERIAVLEKKIDSLSKEKEEYRALFDSIRYGIQEMDAKGTIIYANKAYHESHGYKDGELIGKSMLDFAPTEEKRIELAAYLEYLANEQPPPTPWVGTHLTKGGSPRDIKVDWNYKHDENGKVIGLISLFTDLTEKKKLHENQIKFEAIFNSITDAVVLVDQQRKIILINEAFTEILGYQLEEVAGKTTQFFYANPDEFIEQGKKRYHSEAQAKSPFYEIDYRRKDGTVFPSETLGTAVKDAHGEILGFVGIIRDITERKKAEAALRESKEIFHLLMDSLKAIVYVADMDTYDILFINKYGRETLGDITGKICWQSLQVGQTGPCDFCTNKYIIDADGKPASPHIWDFQNTLTGRWFHITDRAIKWIDGRIVRLEIAIDISDSKNAEMALQESEEKYSQLFNNEIDAIAIFDAETRRIVDCNEAFLELYGYSRKEVLELRADDISAEPEKTAASIKNSAEKGSTRVRRRRHKKKDGSVIIVDISAGPIMLQGRKHMFARLHDITSHVKHEEALHESEERFRVAFLTSPDSININKMDGTYVEVNQGFTELTGYSREDVIGRSSIDINIWDDLEDRKTLVEGLQKNGRYENLEAQFRMKDGSFKTGLLSASIIHLYGEPHILSITRDISARKKAEREKKNLEAQLRQVYKMEAIGTMAGGIAHDFNNILTIILGNADLAKHVTNDDGPAKQYIEHILEASDRAKEMVRQILAFSRKAKQDLVPVKPHIALTETLTLLRSTIPSTVEIRHNFDTECHSIKADPTQLNQILLNLSTNAVYAMDEKGLIDVSLQEVELTEKDIEYKKHLEPGPYAMLTFTDTGKGMSNEVIERIFDPFFTTKKFGDGTGMGLSVVHGIVESHGGMISVESTPGKGTTFRIYFPIIKETASKDKKTSPIHYRGNERILFVDDEESLVEIGTQMLTLLGYQVTAKTNSLKALEAFKTNPGSFDLVITDQTMPNMSGAELAAALLKIRPDIPIILCTGYSSKISDKMAKEIGIADYFMKPFDTENLAMVVRKTLDKA